MISGKTIAVVVPAYNEEALIAETMAGIPSFVDRIFVVDDASRDATVERARGFADPQIEVIVHERNGGVGAAIVTGYQRALAERIDVTAVMAGDNQMDPDELEAIAGPVARGEVDYAKANRLISGRAWELIPRHPLPRQRRPLAADEDRLRLLARRRLAGGLHGDLARDARAARPRPGLHALRLPERPARAPERRSTRGCGHPVAADLRRRRALRDPDPQGRAAHLVAARQGLLLADAREVRDPRLPPARLLLRPRLRDDGRRASRSASSRRCSGSWATASRPATVVLVALLLISGSQFTLFAMWFDMESNKDLR